MTGETTDKILTIPNVITCTRFICIGVFIWLVLIRNDLGWAIVVLLVAGFSDWADGKLARLLHQSSSFGALFDPGIDRIYMVAIPLCAGIRGFIPWWIIMTILARDGCLGLALPLIRSRGIRALPVIYLGKAGTFSLMVAFPLIFLGHWWKANPHGALILGWDFLLWGLWFYLWSFLVYLYQIYLIMHTMPKISYSSINNKL